MNINCQIDKNSFIGIVGKSGSGKSTFCKLISRLYVPNEVLFLLITMISKRLK